MEALKVLFLFLSILLSALVQAQTPPGAPFSTENKLGVTFVNGAEISPGLLVADRATTMRTPHLSISSKLVSTTDTYIVLAVDIDVLQNGTVHTTLLHWFATGLIVPSYPNSRHQKNTTHSGSVPVQPGPTTLDIPGTYWLGPDPPPGAGTHRYVFWLFKQPPNFAVPIQYCLINPPIVPAVSSARLGFNIADFVAATGLESPVAANYFEIAAVPAFPPQSPPCVFCNGQPATC